MKTIKKTNKIFFLALALFFSLNLLAHPIAYKVENNRLNAKVIGNTVLGIDFYAENFERPVGIEIVKIYTNGIGHALGLQEKDILIGVENQPVIAKNINEVFFPIKVGENFTLLIERNGKNLTIQSKMPALKKPSSEKAFLGIETFTAREKSSLGIEIKKTLSNSTAQYIGLVKGDIIVGIDDSPVVADNLNSILAKYHAGDKVLVRVQRNHEILLLPAILGIADSVLIGTKNDSVARL